MGPQKSCRLCEQAQSKYKCPTCLIPYCSLLCFKKHKEIPCVKPVSAAEKETNANTYAHMDALVGTRTFRSRANSIQLCLSATITPPVDIERPCYIDDANDVLQQAQLESIASSAEIREALKDKELQKLICNIDCSADAETELDRAMDQKEFRLFYEKILLTINQSGNKQE